MIYEEYDTHPCEVCCNMTKHQMWFDEQDVLLGHRCVECGDDTVLEDSSELTRSMLEGGQ